jgi:DNA sulfur modification protein DndE
MGPKQLLAINGLPEMNVKNIQITNAGFVSEKGISINDANEISLKNFHLMHTSGIPVSINNAQMITLDNFEITGLPVKFAKSVVKKVKT